MEDLLYRLAIDVLIMVAFVGGMIIVPVAAWKGTKLIDRWI